jgi:predicted transcriptional regulator
MATSEQQNSSKPTMERLSDLEQRKVMRSKMRGKERKLSLLQFNIARSAQYRAAICRAAFFLPNRLVVRMVVSSQGLISAESQAYIEKNPQIKQILQDFTNAV